ncbi:MAG: NlpC/P60 family protein [Balneolales bacterium]
MLHKISSFIAVVTLLTSVCSAQNNLSDKLQSEIDMIRQNHVPDKRVAVFDVSYSGNDNQWTLSGETTSPVAFAELKEMAKKLLPSSHKFNVEMLPSSTLGTRIKGVTYVSVAVLRGTPSHSSEMVDQVVMGTELTILKIKDGWAYVQTPYHYLGWMTPSSFMQMSETKLEEWKSTGLVSVKSRNANIYIQPSQDSRVLRDAVMNSQIKRIAENGEFTEVELPDGARGYIYTHHLGQVIKLDNSKKPDEEKIIQIAHMMHGLPYLWGGNSTKGFDCSGFTRTVFETAGYQLPRDASQQVQIGTEVSPNSTFSNVEPGDLIFFGPSSSRITHVGISLGGDQFIHASNYVRINSLLPAEENYSAYRRGMLQVIKRVGDQ